jgi:hypothetical protein
VLTDDEDFSLCVIVALIFGVLKFFVVTTCYSYGNSDGVIITCTFDVRVSNKSIHQFKPRIQSQIHVTIFYSDNL